MQLVVSIIMQYYFNFSERIKNVGAQSPTNIPHLSACAISSGVPLPEAKFQATIDAIIETNPATKILLITL